jgi:hypothetical protein
VWGLYHAQVIGELVAVDLALQQRHAPVAEAASMAGFDEQASLAERDFAVSEEARARQEEATAE